MRLCGSAASMAAALNGLDTLVFTGGVGENSPRSAGGPRSVLPGGGAAE